MDENLMIDINNYLQEMTENLVTPMYGVREKDSLSSISQSLNQEVFGMELYPTIIDKAAFLWFCLSNYHCFYNGNKRTALVVTYVFLKINGFQMKVNKSFYEISFNIIEDKLTKEEIVEIIKANINELDEVISESPLEIIKNDLNSNKEFKTVIVKLSET